MQEIILKIRYFERGFQKALKMLNLFSFFEPVPFNGHDYERKKEPETCD